jgi:hypothetical protein
MKKYYYGEQSGQALIIALIFLLFVVLIITPLLILMSTTSKSAAVYSQNTESLYSADAGVQDAIWQMKQNLSNPNTGTINNLSINGTGVTVTITSSGTDYLIVSKATGTRGSTTVNSLVSVSAGTMLFSNALSTGLGGDITLNGSSVINSNGSGGAPVFSGGSLNINGSSSITGNAFADSNITFANSSCKINGNASAAGTVGTVGTVSGTKTSGAGTQTPNSLSTATLNNTVQGICNETTNIGTIISSPPGVITVSGNLTIANGSDSNGVPITGGHIAAPVYVTGNLILQNVNTITFDQQLYVNGNITFAGVQTDTFTGPVYAGGYITSSGTESNIFNNTLTIGSVPGSSTSYINLGGSGSFAFNGNLKDMGNFYSGGSISTTFGGTIFVGGNFDYEGSSNLNINHDIYINGTLLTGGSAGAIIGPEDIVVRGYGSNSSNHPAVSVNGASAVGTGQLPFIIVPPAATTPAITGPDPALCQLTGSATVSALFYAPTTAFTNSGSASLFGAVISQTITLSGSATITYPSNLTALRPNLPYSNGSGNGSGISILAYIIGNLTP